MTKDELRLQVLRKSTDLCEWFQWILEYREQRATSEIENLVLAVKDYWDSGGLTIFDAHLIWDDFTLVTQRYIKCPANLARDTKITAIPVLEAQEYALLCGLIFARRAIECFKSNSSKEHLFGASLLADMVDAQGYWMATRGITRCRNPDVRFVEVESDIQEFEFKGWLKEKRSNHGRHAADIRHNKQGGSRDKQEQIRAIWATGKYKSRDVCAEQECASLGMSFSAARRALRNTPHA